MHQSKLGSLSRSSCTFLALEHCGAARISRRATTGALQWKLPRRSPQPLRLKCGGKPEESRDGCVIAHASVGVSPYFIPGILSIASVMYTTEYLVVHHDANEPGSCPYAILTFLDCYGKECTASVCRLKARKKCLGSET